MVDRDLQRHSRPPLRANPARDPSRALRDRSGLSLNPRPYKAARSMMNDCPRCLGSHWVCEAHPERLVGRQRVPRLRLRRSQNALPATTQVTNSIRQRCRPALSKGARAHDSKAARSPAGRRPRLRQGHESLLHRNGLFVCRFPSINPQRRHSA